MALDHALLVSLLEKPSSGYELARRFDRSIGYFWHATHQQIYRVLSRMEAAQWIVAEIKAGDNAPDRKVFSVSPAGRAELSRWMAQASEPEGTRDVLMVKLRGAAFGDVDPLILDFERHRAEHANRLTAYRVIEARDFAGAQSASPGVQGTCSRSDVPGIDGPRTGIPVTQSESTGMLDRQSALQYQVLKSGIRYEQSWLEWSDETLALLRSFKTEPLP